MPVWNLRYPDTVDDRIRAREDAACFREDLYVHAVFIRRDPEIPRNLSTPISENIGGSRYYWVDVHLNEGETTTQDPDLGQLATDNVADQTLPRPNSPLSLDRYPTRAEERGMTTQEAFQTLTVLGSIDPIMLARSMVAPLRRNLDYNGLARRTLLVDEISMGTTPGGFSVHPADRNARIDQPISDNLATAVQGLVSLYHSQRSASTSEPQEPGPVYKTRFERLLEGKISPNSNDSGV